MATDEVRTARAAYSMQMTGRTRTLASEFGGPMTLPEVEISATHPHREIDAIDAVVELDGESYYLDEDPYLFDPEPGCSAWVLSRTRSCFLVAGKDVYTYETRTAPQTCAGICAWPKGAISRHDEPAFAVIPPELGGVRSERRRREQRRSQQAAALAEYRTRDAEFEAAKATHEVERTVVAREARQDAFSRLASAARAADFLGVFQETDVSRPSWLS